MKTLKIMMIALMMCFVNVSFGQDKFEIKENGITNLVVEKFDSINKQDLFSYVLTSLNDTGLLSVLKNQNNTRLGQTTIKNDTIEVIVSTYIKISMSTNEYSYVIYKLQFLFKDNSYLMKVLDFKYRDIRGWENISFSDIFKYKSYLNSKGKVRFQYKYLHNITDEFNTINNNIVRRVINIKNEVNNKENKIVMDNTGTLSIIKPITREEINNINLRLNGVNNFGKQHRTGNHFLIAGFLTTAIGTGMFLQPNTIPEVGTGLLILGGILSTSGIIINIDSFKHLRTTK
jgi:hypothetical protein